jgi:hypothetical protein
MRKTLILAIYMTFLVNQLNGQSFMSQNLKGGNSFASDANGMPMYQKTEYRSEGSPYFYNDYCFADVTAMNGKTYTGVRIKINLEENKVLYLNDENGEMIATATVKRIKFLQYIQDGKSYESTILESPGAAINDPGAPVYQLLEDSTAKLYKHISITYNDSKPYGEATITRIFSRKETYYAMVPSIDSSLHKLERNRDAIVSLLKDQATHVDKFINAGKLNCKKEKDLIAIFRFYNQH